VQTSAVVLAKPRQVSVTTLTVTDPGESDVVVDIEWSGISAGTERLLWAGEMPPFPGMGYPLVPGYESVGRIVSAGGSSGRRVGERVFVPGARCYGAIRGLFGGSASRVVVPGEKVTAVPDALGEQSILLALAATAHHAIHRASAEIDLVVGHGVLGRLLARLLVQRGGSPTVWENDGARADGARGYRVISPEADPRRDYHEVCDVSGDAALLDSLIGRLAPRGELLLAGFYSQPMAFSFAPAFMREVTLRVSAEWRPEDLAAVTTLLSLGALSLEGLITHRSPAPLAAEAYVQAFTDRRCLKMILDWRDA
jgi:3-hydroxyethyl bacteriochlorophyllide a dehydrogenase